MMIIFIIINLKVLLRGSMLIEIYQTVTLILLLFRPWKRTRTCSFALLPVQEKQIVLC